ncbi:hypothetical protein QZJ86_18160 [Methylomonas montana]|uniref:glycosyltransferase n=1 Tax=Methylomonas montana TaxID=3058963 RepID=UPI002659BFBA|nr:glycosyltransferase [Methylomonas montana]WKJ89908.1 hypothetical protein QZJ86_18160 [Methylomonas montana]
MNLDLKVHKLIDQLPWLLASRLKQYFPVPVGHYFVVSKTPLVVLIPEDFFDNESLWIPFFDVLKRRRVYFLGLVRSGIEYYADTYKQLFSPVLLKHSKIYPEHRFIFLANNAAQTQIYDDLGVESVFVNQNCLADETRFKVDADVAKQFDAIHNAVSAPYKRHELTRLIERLAIITYLSTQHLDYFEEIKAILGHASWLNFPQENVEISSFRQIPRDDVCGYINQARVGLCLSETEGAMFASIEYLLSGLPVVSTHSYGGRDVFFDDDYVAIVEADPEAVNEGVNRMIERNIDPLKIREETLRKMEEHRQRFVNMIVDISAREGIEANAQHVYAETFPNQLYKLRPLHKILDCF